MHQHLLQAEQSLGIQLDSLRAASTQTKQTLGEARGMVREYLSGELGDEVTQDVGVDIYAFGSIGRAEMGNLSDFDYLVVVNNTEVSPQKIVSFRRAAADALERLRMKDPGTTGMFGVAIGATQLVTVIGLNDDSNLNMSRRVLVLQESVPLNPHNKWESNVRVILQRYLLDYYGKPAGSYVPRFLLNDVVRFWRTVAVDYQAKRWLEMHGSKAKWGLRYIKLRSSRKWSFAGNVIALFMPVIAGVDTTATYLHEQFEMPPLARLAQLHSFLPPDGDAADALRDVLVICDWFVGQLSREDWRVEIGGVEDPTARPKPDLFRQAQAKTSELQISLERLFFSSDPLGTAGLSLGQLSRKYMSF